MRNTKAVLDLDSMYKICFISKFDARFFGKIHFKIYITFDEVKYCIKYFMARLKEAPKYISKCFSKSKIKLKNPITQGIILTRGCP